MKCLQLGQLHRWAICLLLGLRLPSTTCHPSEKPPLLPWPLHHLSDLPLPRSVPPQCQRARLCSLRHSPLALRHPYLPGCLTPKSHHPRPNSIPPTMSCPSIHQRSSTLNRNPTRLADNLHFGWSQGTSCVSVACPGSEQGATKLSPGCMQDRTTAATK